MSPSRRDFLKAGVVLLGMGLSGSLTGAFAGEQSAPQKYVWKEDDLVGVSLERVHPEKVESYSFGKDGIVAATFGLADGPVTAPVFKWRIQDGLLRIVDEEDREQAEFRLIEWTPGHMWLYDTREKQRQEFRATRR